MNVTAAKSLDEGRYDTISSRQECGGEPWAGHMRRAAAIVAPGQARWYCVQTERARETEVRDRLEDQGFGAFLPLVIEMRPVRPGIKQAKAVPAFPTYLFVRFNRHTDRWRSILYTRGVRGLFCSTPDYPTPLRQGEIEALMALGYDRPIAQDPRPALIAAGAKVRVTEGPFTDREGICLWDDRKRVALLMEILGRLTPVTLERRAVALLAEAAG